MLAVFSGSLFASQIKGLQRGSSKRLLVSHTLVGARRDKGFFQCKLSLNCCLAGPVAPLARVLTVRVAISAARSGGGSGSGCIALPCPPGQLPPWTCLAHGLRSDEVGSLPICCLVSFSGAWGLGHISGDEALSQLPNSPTICSAGAHLAQLEPHTQRPVLHASERWVSRGGDWRAPSRSHPLSRRRMPPLHAALAWLLAALCLWVAWRLRGARCARAPRCIRCITPVCRLHCATTPPNVAPAATCITL